MNIKCVHRSGLSLIFNLQCNEFCEYCDLTADRISPILEFEDFEPRLNLLEKYIDLGDKINITGGEPGLLSKNTMQKILSRYSTKKIVFDSNGAIFDHELSENISVNLHVLHLNDFQKAVDNREHVEKIVFVLHRKNKELMEPVIIKSRELGFTLNLQLFNPKVMDKSLMFTQEDLEEISEIYERFRPFLNPDLKRELQLLMINNGTLLEKHRKFCVKNYPHVVFDIGSNKIVQCCISRTMSNEYEINDHNLQKLTENNLFSEDLMEYCNYCFKVYNLTDEMIRTGKFR